MNTPKNNSLLGYYDFLYRYKISEYGGSVRYCPFRLFLLIDSIYATLFTINDSISYSMVLGIPLSLSDLLGTA